MKNYNNKKNYIFRLSCFLFLLISLMAPLRLSAAEMALPSPSGSQVTTTINSQTLEMVSGPEENVFYFSKNVVVNGSNLRMKADQMVVTSKRQPDTSGSLANAPSQNLNNPDGSIDKIVAVGNVHIYQSGRESVSGRAEFYPKDGRVILTDNPRVIDSKAIVSGWRITLFQGERKVMVEQDPNGAPGSRPSVNLSSLPNLGFDPRTEPPAQPAPPPVGAPAPVIKAITL